MTSLSRCSLTATILLLNSNFTLSEEALRLPLKVNVEAGQRERKDCLVQFALAAGVSGNPSLRVVDVGNPEVPVASQLDQQSGCLWWVGSGTIPVGGTRQYRLEAGPATRAEEIKLIDTDRAMDAQFMGKPLLRYNKAHVEPPSGVDPKFGRSAHLHPVWTPSGASVTDEFPPDHLHQSGVFLAYTKTKFEDRDVDFWNLAGGKGRVRFKELKEFAGGPVFAQFRTVQEHVDLTAPTSDQEKPSITTGGKPALAETWNVRIWNSGWKSGYWLLDIESQARCASASPLKLPEYHYGGMAIRAARPWTPQHVSFLTSEGNERIKGNHTRPRWCDVTGAIDGKPAGAVLMTHPSNFRFPEPLRIHPTMPYMVYTPSFLGDWEIAPGSAHESRYRFVIHDGELSAETIEQLWRDYAEPLEAKIVR